MHHFLISACVFFLFSVSAPVWAHPGHSDNSGDAEIAIQFHKQFLKYLKDPDGAADLTTDAYVTINGHRYALNSSFYELLRLAIKAAAPEVCSSCVVKEVQEKSDRFKFLKKWVGKFRNLFSINTVAYGEKLVDEYGYAAGAGYVLMEILEHTFLGPLGFCPILNIYYLSMLDNIKQGQYVFQSTYKQSVFKAVYFSFRSAFETMRLNHALKNPVFKPKDDAIGAPVEGHMSWDIFKGVRKTQGRYGWFLWSSWLDTKLSSRTLWPSAYMSFDVEKSGSQQHGHDHESPFKMLMMSGVPEEGTKPFLSCESTSSSFSCDHDEPISEDRLRDIYFILDAEQSQIQRYIIASLLQDVLLFEAQALDVQIQAELTSKRAENGTWDYLRKGTRFNRLNAKIKKYGASLKSFAMSSTSVSEVQKEQAVKNLRDMLDIFQKASLLREQEQSFSPLLEDIEKLLTCQDLLT